MSEANFWKEIKKNIGHIGHWSRIESHATADGFPDTAWTVMGTEAKIELKHGTIKKKIEIRPSQVRWFRKNVKNGGRPWLFAKIDNMVSPIYLLFKGETVLEIYNITDTNTLAEMSDYAWIGKVPWDKFVEIILKEGT